MHTSSHSVSSQNVSDQVPVQVCEGHEDRVYCACFYPDENKLVSGSDDKTLRIWDLGMGAVEVLSGHTKWVSEVDVSLDGKMVVSGSGDKTVRIWNGESGEKMNVLKGHRKPVMSVQFSPDSSRVVSGSRDSTVRVWSVETGQLVFGPIKCRKWVDSARYSPSGDRIASGGTVSGVQIWDADTGTGILSIRDSTVCSLAWTRNGTHIIGGRHSQITIWNSHNGECLRIWNVAQNDWIRTLSLPLNGTYLATCVWNDKTAFVFNISTGEQVVALKHDSNVKGIAYSPSGQFIATGCEDNKVDLWDPQTFGKSPIPSFSSFLDTPAAGPLRNDGRGVDRFWDDPSDLPQAATAMDRDSSLARQVLNRVNDTFTNLFTRRPVGATQNSPTKETVELVEVAAGKDRPYAATIDPPKFTRVQKILYTLIHCRKPDEEEEEAVAAPDTAADSSRVPAGKTVIDTQPQSNEMIAGPSSTQSAIPKVSKVSTRAPTPPTPPTDSSPAVAQARSSVPSLSTVATTSMPLLVSSNSSPPTSTQHSSQHMDSQLGNTLTAEEVALLQEYRRLRDASASGVFRVVAEPSTSNTPRPTANTEENDRASGEGTR